MALPLFRFDFKANIKTLIDTLFVYAQEGHVLHIEKVSNRMDYPGYLTTTYHVTVNQFAGAVNEEHRHSLARKVTKLSIEVSSIENIVDCRVDQRPKNEQTRYCMQLSVVWKMPS